MTEISELSFPQTLRGTPLVMARTWYGGAMYDPGQYWAHVDNHWTIVTWDGQLWQLEGRVVRPGKVGQYIASE